MGISSSKDAAAAASAARQDRKRREEEEIQRRGVLIPPSFGVASLSTATTGAPSAVVLSSGLSSLQGRLPWLRPSLLYDLSVHDVSYRILKDYMQTGFWLSSSVNQNSRYDTNVKAAFLFQDPPSFSTSSISSTSSRASSSSPTGLITLQRSSLSSLSSVDAPTTSLPTTSTRVCFGTSDAPSATASWQRAVAVGIAPPLHVAVLGHASVDGIGWVGGHAEVPLNLPRNNHNDSNEARVRLGGWLAGSAKKKKKPTGADAQFAFGLSSSPSSYSWKSFPDEVSGYAAIDMLGSTAAMEVQLPLQTLQYESRSYFSINLTDAPQRNTDATTNSGAVPSPHPAPVPLPPPPPPPPLVVTLERTHSHRENTSSLALSQILHMDRYQINPLEDRAPRIRNALAWTIRLDRVEPSQRNHYPNAMYLSHDEAIETLPGPPGGGGSTTCSVGGAWQINRGVAVKAVAHSDRTVTTAVLLRRWKEPRITCSAMFRYDLKNDARPRYPHFLGLGVQVELGNDLRHEYADEPASYYATTDASVPETKASLPTRKP